MRYYDEDDEVICGSCDGSGEGHYDGTTCDRCHGRGVEPGQAERDRDDEREYARELEWERRREEDWLDSLEAR